LFKLEVDKLKNMFIKNAYPASFFDKIYKRFLDKIENTQVLNTDAGEEKFKFNLSIPYIGKQSVKFGQKISALVTDKFDIDINLVYTTTKVGSFFRLKSMTPAPLVSCVVYEFRCLGDQTATYVGMAERNMTLRVADHIRKSSKTAVGIHRKSCQACQNTKLSTEHFKIQKKKKVQR
jgi:hypothetical protein